MTQQDQLIEQIQAYLEYKQEEGIQTLEVSPETLAALRPAPRPIAPPKPRVQPVVRPVLNQTAPVAAALEDKPAVVVTGKTLEAIAKQVSGCTACPLSETRTNTVPGEGNADHPDIMFIGEGPGADEDEQGRPFVGAAGQLLNKMITAMGYKREEVFIANIVKCRPPGNRVPSADEMNACIPYLKAQIALVQPKIIVGLGKTAVEGLLQKPVAITRFRGTWSKYEGIDLMPTYHPAFLLRSPGRKGEAWADLKTVLAKLGKEPPSKK